MAHKLQSKHEKEFIEEVFRQLRPFGVTKVEIDGISYTIPRKENEKTHPS